MRRQVEDWTVEELSKERSQITFPEYQRQPNLWSDEKKSLLIDSILEDIDIPKLYFNRTKDGSFEVVDGQQRLWAIWEFLDGQYAHAANGKPKTFPELTSTQREWIKGYKLQVTVFQDANDEYLRKLFVRLQLGLLLITGEKLHAAVGVMKNFVFDEMVQHHFIKSVGISKNRFSKETLCAQIAINAFTRANVGTFARTRYEDLAFFFREYEHPQGKDLEFYQEQSKKIISVLDQLWKCFGDRTPALKNRSYILSVYLLFQKVTEEGPLSPGDQKLFVDFVLKLWKRVKEEVAAGFDRKNRELYSFQSLVSSAPGEKYQIERRDEKLIEFYRHFKLTGKIKGDK